MIRFKKDDGSAYPEWEEKALNELYPNIRNGFVGVVSEHFSDKENGVRYIEGTNIHDGIISDNVEVYVTKEFHKKHIKNELKADDILMVQSGHVGDCAVVGDKYKGSNCHALIIMSNGGKCDSKFMCEYFHSYTGRKKLSVLVTGNTVKHILSSDMNNFRSKVPCLEEQQKIADFLSSVDEVIAESEKEIANLEAQKKGAMQKIFSQEVRFKADDGSDYPEWEEKTLSSLGAFYGGLSGKTKEDFGTGSGKYITYMNVFKNLFVKQSLLESVDVAGNEKQNKVQYGDMIFTQSSETVEEVGMTSVYLFDDKPYLNSFCMGFHFHDLLITNPCYMGYLMRTDKIRKQIMREGQGISRINLSANRIMDILLDIPCLEEQKKIANFLSDFDTAIEEAKKELECWKQIKKGLLQQMFV